MAEVFTGWQNRNEGRNYPLHDMATKAAVGGDKLPDDILADAHIALPRSAGRFVFVSSAAVSPALVSLTFLALENDPYNGGVAGTFVPLAVIAIRKPVVPYRNYPVEAEYPGVGGWVAFGTGAAETNGLALRFDSPIATTLASRAVRSYEDHPVTSLGRTNSAVKLTGLVYLQGQPGLVKVKRAVREIGGINREALVIGLDLESAASAEDLLLQFAGQCKRPEQRTCPEGKAILKINGVEPDCDGNIRIRVQGLDASVVGAWAEADYGDGKGPVPVAGGNIIDLPLGLTDICPVFDPARFDPADLCESSLSSESEAPEYPPEWEESSLASSESGLPDEYCDDFEDAAESFAVLVPMQGAWSIENVTHGDQSSHRLVSERGNFGPQVIIHDTLYKAPDPDASPPVGYRVEATIRPRTERGNGHVIFGYKSLDDFWFAGFSLDTADSVAGLFYAGHKTAGRSTSLDNWPDGLDNGYFFAHTVPPSWDFPPGGAGGGSRPPLGAQGLHGTDVRMSVEVDPIAAGSPINLVRVGFAWNEDLYGWPAGLPFANMIFTVSPADSNLKGYCGVGVVGSETEFDALGVDCDLWAGSSSVSA